MTILFAENDFWTNNLEFREKYAQVVREAFAAVRQLLPIVPENLTFVNQVAPYECMEDYGQGGYTKNSTLIIISIDDRLPFGEEKLLEFTRQTVFHELNHAVRFEKGIYHKSFLESCILEGLATAFERDYAPATPPYGDYKLSKVKVWLDEIATAGQNIKWYEYMYHNSGGERWIGYKVGTYLVDEAIKASGKSILELTTMATQNILELAGVTDGPPKS